MGGPGPSPIITDFEREEPVGRNAPVLFGITAGSLALSVLGQGACFLLLFTEQVQGWDGLGLALWTFLGMISVGVVGLVSGLVGFIKSGRKRCLWLALLNVLVATWPLILGLIAEMLP